MHVVLYAKSVLDPFVHGMLGRGYRAAFGDYPSMLGGD